MPRLRVKEFADARKLTISKLGRDADISLPSARRYYYGTGDGRADGPPLQSIDLPTLEKIANALGVNTLDLLIED
jgi:hypothetical protein